MDFESMKPMIEFQVLRQIMDRLVNVNGGGCGGCCGGCCGPQKQAQPIRMPEEQKQKKKTFKRKIEPSKPIKSNRKPTNQVSKETEGMLTTTAQKLKYINEQTLTLRNLFVRATALSRQ